MSHWDVEETILAAPDKQGRYFDYLSRLTHRIGIDHASVIVDRTGQITLNICIYLFSKILIELRIEEKDKTLKHGRQHELSTDRKIKMLNNRKQHSIQMKKKIK